MVIFLTICINYVTISYNSEDIDLICTREFVKQYAVMSEVIVGCLHQKIKVFDLL